MNRSVGRVPDDAPARRQVAARGPCRGRSARACVSRPWRSSSSARCAARTQAVEARELAALLVAAAEPARFDVSRRRGRACARLGAPASGGHGGAACRLLVAAAAVVVVGAAFVFLRTPGDDVQARALAAVQPTFFVVEEIRPAQPALPSKRGLRLRRRDARPRAHADLVARRTCRRGRTPRETGASRAGSPRATRSLLATSCDRLPGGCAEALDPLTLYTRTLADDGVTSRAGRRRLPVDDPRCAARRDRRRGCAFVSPAQDRVAPTAGGSSRRTRFLALEPQREAPDADTWRLDEHPRAVVRQYGRAGRPVRVLAVRPGSLGANDRWLGRAYGSVPARVTTVELTDGRATRIDYGPLTVWNFGTIVPPPVLQGRNAPAKVFPIRGGVAHVYYGAGSTVVAEASARRSQRRGDQQRR